MYSRYHCKMFVRKERCLLIGRKAGYLVKLPKKGDLRLTLQELVPNHTLLHAKQNTMSRHSRQKDKRRTGCTTPPTKPNKLNSEKANHVEIKSLLHTSPSNTA
ncbi:unnamed protein product [Trichobilharzia szidati]|nr:unnamed protein product [Trichobilharzia szidati]